MTCDAPFARRRPGADSVVTGDGVPNTGAANPAQKSAWVDVFLDDMQD